MIKYITPPRFIESLDKDNFHEDPNITAAKLPSFDERPTAKKRKKANKRRFPKSFAVREIYSFILVFLYLYC